MRYSERSVRAQNFLKRHYNDIDVVVEDSANRNIWYAVVRACLPAHVKIASITLAGGRSAVEAACALDQAEDDRRRIYIVDGDFDYLLGKPKKRLKHLHRIRGFNVENLILQDEAIIQLAMTSDPLCSPEEVLDRLRISTLISEVSESLRALFCLYAVSEKFGSGIKTCDFKVERLCDVEKSGYILDLSRLKVRAISMSRELFRRYGAKAVRSEFSDISERSASLPDEMVVSGKSYLLPFVHYASQRRFGYRGSRESLKVSLAFNCARCPEPSLKARFTRLINA